MSETVKRQRKQRRDFGRIMKELEVYCNVFIDVVSTQAPSEFGKGQLSMARVILEKLTGTTGTVSGGGGL